LALPAAVAQTAVKTLHIGILSSGTFENRNSLERSLVQGLRDRATSKARTSSSSAATAGARPKDNAVELAGMNLDAVMTTCTPSTRLMKDATSLTPIVMAAVSDPVGQGIVASLAKPGQNVTGTSSQAEDLLAKAAGAACRAAPDV
jgi:putative ABC transport system substrate-binding protein